MIVGFAFAFGWMLFNIAGKFEEGARVVFYALCYFASLLIAVSGITLWSGIAAIVIALVGFGLAVCTTGAIIARSVFHKNSPRK